MMDEIPGKYYGKTKSERLSSFFAETMFFRPFCFPNPLFGKNGGGELCDCLLVSRFGTIIIQVKESMSDSRKSEEHWYKKKIEQNAFRQVENAMSAIRNGEAIYDSSKKEIPIDRSLPIQAVIVFDNEKIESYDGFIDKNGIEINVFSLDAFKAALNGIVTPKEFLKYLGWRYKRMKNFDYGEYQIIPIREGFLAADVLSHKDIRNDETFNVASYIYNHYPDHPLSQKDERTFHSFSKVFADANNSEDFLEYLSTFDYLEISGFWEEWNKAFIDDGKAELHHYGGLWSKFGVSIFIFCKCTENARLFPGIVDYAIHCSYKRHEFNKAFILVATHSYNPKGYNMELTRLDFSIPEQKQDFLQTHAQHLDDYLD